MTAKETIHIPTIAGTPFQGGFYVGFLRSSDGVYALIVAPKAEGELADAEWGKYGEDLADAEWGKYGEDLAVARSCHDGHANTVAMAEAGSELARWTLALDIGGHADWYLPSRDELELCYRHLKPTTGSNWVYRHGENPSSLPAGYPYSADSPTQTPAEAFKSGGAEAFEPEWYWSSTQYSPGDAWGQDFGGGGQDGDVKGSALRARAVRRFKISD